MRVFFIIVSAFLTASMLHFHQAEYVAMLHEAVATFSVPSVNERHRSSVPEPTADDMAKWGN